MSNGPPSHRDRRSLQDLAKLANAPSLAPLSSQSPVSQQKPGQQGPASLRNLGPVSARTPTPPPASVKSEHDSGIVDLQQMATADSAAAERAKTTPLASAPLFDDDDPPAAPTSQAPKSAPASAPQAAASAPASGKAVSPKPATAPAKSSSLLMPVLGGLALAAMAAAGFVYLRPSKAPRPAPLQTAAPAPIAAAPLPPGPSDPAPQASAEPAPSPAPVASAGDPAPSADPAALPSGTPKMAGPAQGGGRRAAGAAPALAKVDETPGGSTVTGLGAMMAQATNSSPTAPLSAGSLGDAVQRAVGDKGNAPAAAAGDTPSGPQFAPGSVPEKPSQGAVTGALGRVLPQARGCLNPDDPISRANVTFASAGTVTSVVVTGFAAGKPAEDCIKRALSNAGLPPFAQSSYAANVTIRPN